MKREEEERERSESGKQVLSPGPFPQTAGGCPAVVLTTTNCLSCAFSIPRPVLEDQLHALLRDALHFWSPNSVTPASLS